MQPTLGNDIVDLNDAADKTKDSRFLNRVFSENEQVAISQASNPHHYLWLLWSLKEAAFKAYQKQNLDYRFSPIACQVQIDDSDKNNTKVRINDCVIDCRYQIKRDYIECTACLGESTKLNLINSVKKIAPGDYAHQSKQVRQLAYHLLQQQHMDEYRIVRLQLTMPDYNKKAPPQLINAAKELGPQISLSHDGHYIAAAILL